MSLLIRRILVIMLCTAIGRGLVFAFGLDQKVANMVRAMMTPEIKEAIPWLLAGIIGLIGVSIWEVRPKWLQRNHLFLPDMRISEALNYIVNDSTANLKQPPPPIPAVCSMSVCSMQMQDGK
jgi:hypothetical protein